MILVFLLILITIVLFIGFLTFKIMSLLGCYVRIGDVDTCWKLTAINKKFMSRDFMKMYYRVYIYLL